MWSWYKIIKNMILNNGFSDKQINKLKESGLNKLLSDKDIDQKEYEELLKLVKIAN